MKTMQEILFDIKNQFEENANSYGEPQAWLYLEDKDRSIEITHEKEGLSKDEEFYSLILHCNEKEFDNDDFYSTNGIIERYNAGTISDEQLIEGIEYLETVNKKY